MGLPRLCAQNSLEELDKDHTFVWSRAEAKIGRGSYWNFTNLCILCANFCNKEYMF